MQAERIAIDGPESTGKSELAIALALHFNAGFVPEAARKYLEELGRNYKKDDLVEIAQLQCRIEDETARHHNIIFCDTTLLVIKVWSEYKYGTCDERIENEFRKRKYSLHLLTNIDLPWQDDVLREHPYEREALFNHYHNVLRESGYNYEIITGTGITRVERAIQYCKSIL
jgi:NadR type nicotinamide-nucleotide adenylyltransferase